MENMNDYKMVVICEDGEIRYFGEVNEYNYHIQSLRDYIYTYYNELAKKIDADNKDDMYIIYYLTIQKNVVYLVSPKFGLLFLPQKCSEKQKESLYKFAKDIEGVSVYVGYNLSKKGEEIYYPQSNSYDLKLPISEILDLCLDQSENTNQKSL